MNVIGGDGGGGVFVGDGVVVGAEEQGGGAGEVVVVVEAAGGEGHQVAAEEEGGGGGAADRSNAVKVVMGAIMETVIVGSTTYCPIAKSLPGALSVAYAALFLAILLFLLILLLRLRLLPRPSAVAFAERAAVGVVFLVPLLAVAAKAYSVLNSKANVNHA